MYISRLSLLFVVISCIMTASLSASVTSTTPDPGKLHEILIPNISVTFDTDMDESSFTTETVIVKGSQQGVYLCTYSYDDASRTLTISNPEAFMPGEIVTIFLTNGILSSTSEPLEPYSWFFTTRTYSDPLSSAGSVPEQMALQQNYPNPFNPATTIGYTIQQDTQVLLRVLDVNGRLVEVLVNEHQKAGRHSVTFDASALPGGVYLYTLEAEQEVLQKKMVLLK